MKKATTYRNNELMIIINQIHNKLLKWVINECEREKSIFLFPDIKISKLLVTLQNTVCVSSLSITHIHIRTHPNKLDLSLPQILSLERYHVSNSRFCLKWDFSNTIADNVFGLKWVCISVFWRDNNFVLMCFLKSGNNSKRTNFLTLSFLWKIETTCCSLFVFEQKKNNQN
jgi:hypothetical protein